MAKKLSNAARIRNYMAAHPNAKPMDIADKLEISVSQIYVERNKIKLREKALKEQANTGLINLYNQHCGRLAVLPPAAYVWAV